jgi:hypothetical protein
MDRLFEDILEESDIGDLCHGMFKTVTSEIDSGIPPNDMYHQGPAIMFKKSQLSVALGEQLQEFSASSWTKKVNADLANLLLKPVEIGHGKSFVAPPRPDDHSGDIGDAEYAKIRDQYKNSAHNIGFNVYVQAIDLTEIRLQMVPSQHRDDARSELLGLGIYSLEFSFSKCQ